MQCGISFLKQTINVQSQIVYSGCGNKAAKLNKSGAQNSENKLEKGKSYINKPGGSRCEKRNLSKDYLLYTDLWKTGDCNTGGKKFE